MLHVWGSLGSVWNSRWWGGSGKEYDCWLLLERKESYQGYLWNISIVSRRCNWIWFWQFERVGDFQCATSHSPWNKHSQHQHPSQGSVHPLSNSLSFSDCANCDKIRICWLANPEIAARHPPLSKGEKRFFLNHSNLLFDVGLNHVHKQSSKFSWVTAMPEITVPQLLVWACISQPTTQQGKGTVCYHEKMIWETKSPRGT